MWVFYHLLPTCHGRYLSECLYSTQLGLCIPACSALYFSRGPSNLSSHTTSCILSSRARWAFKFWFERGTFSYGWWSDILWCVVNSGTTEDMAVSVNIFENHFLKIMNPTDFIGLKSLILLKELPELAFWQKFEKPIRSLLRTIYQGTKSCKLSCC